MFFMTTIQQLNMNIRDINTIREQVSENDVGEFDKKITFVKIKALEEISSLQQLIESSQDDRSDIDGVTHTTGQLSLSPVVSDTSGMWVVVFISVYSFHSSKILSVKLLDKNLCWKGELNN